MEKPVMSSAQGWELNTSINSRVWFVATPGRARGLYMISVMTSGVLRVDGPGGSRSSVNPDVDCPWAGAPPKKTKRVKAKAGVAKRNLTTVRCFINGQNGATAPKVVSGRGL